MTPEKLRAEADEYERMASHVGLEPDRDWLLGVAKRLRSDAVKLEERSWAVREPREKPKA